MNEKIADVRLKKIQEVLNNQQNQFNKSFLGKTINVLFTGRGKKINQFVGRTPHLQPVHVFSNYDLTGQLLKVELSQLTSFSFHGKLSN